MPSLTLRDGCTLSYDAAGTGPLLILVHGSPGEGRSWSRVAAHLTGRHRVLMPDLPGYGGSDPLPADTTARTAAMADAVGALIEACGEPVLLCGHSYGGNVALHAALSHAAHISSLALFEPVFFRALHLVGDTQVLPTAASFFTAYAYRVTGGEPAAVSEMIDYWFGPGAFTRLPSPVQRFLTTAAPKNGADVRATFAETVTRAQLAAFEKPALVAYGSASPPVAPAIARALVGLLPRACLQPIPDASHGMLDSHAGEVAALILAA